MRFFSVNSIVKTRKEQRMAEKKASVEANVKNIRRRTSKISISEELRR
jgi:hypothetical protein